MSAGILYLHGFCSSPASWKARLLAKAIEGRGLDGRFFCPALSFEPNAAIAQAEEIITTEDRPLTLVGSSLGGYYATYLAEKHDLRAVLINPAVVAPISLNNTSARKPTSIPANHSTSRRRISRSCRPWKRHALRRSAIC